MARINSELLDRLRNKLGVKRSQVYSLIGRKAADTFLPPNLAAIALAAEKGIGIARYASAEDLAQIRQAGATITPPIQLVSQKPEGKSPPASKRKKDSSKKSGRGPGTRVFVVHGRNERLRRSIFSFLRSVGIQPIEWREAIKLTRKGSPYVGEILDAAFTRAVAIIVLLSPDEEARLKPQFVKANDPSYEKQLSGQARPNVLFEAGMAFGRYPNQTILVQVGQVRPFSDVGGRHVVQLSNSTESRQELITKLENAGCIVSVSGTDWHTEGDFDVN